MNYSSNFHKTSTVKFISFACYDLKEEDDKKRAKQDDKCKHCTKTDAKDGLDDWANNRAEKSVSEFQK